MPIVLSAKSSKLMQLCELKGFGTLDEMLDQVGASNRCPAICTTEGCGYVTESGSDERAGRCPLCGGETVVSALVLAGDDGRRSERIRALNDAFRTTFRGGQVVMTPSVDELPDCVKADALCKLANYRDFDEDNDQFGEHDFGSFEVVGRRFFWKIDYYDRQCRFGSDDPADPEKTSRVLTLMLAEDY